MDLFDELISKADTGDKQAMYEFHNLCHDESIVKQIYDKKHINSCKKKVTDQKPYTLYKIALCEFFINNDLEKTLNYLERSMTAGCSQAFWTMATMICEEIFDEKYDPDELLKTAAKMKNSNAYIDIAINHDDENEKIKWFKKAIKMGNSNGFHKLGFLALSRYRKFCFGKEILQKSL
jgi:hypothetical protein